MNENKKRTFSGRGLGVGYVTLIMLFAVICLTILAALSYQAAHANEKLVDKNVSFCTAYYKADGKAKQTLSRLDDAALTAHKTGFFADSFAELSAEFEGVTVKAVPEGFEVSFSEPINERLSLSVSAVFFENPSEERYRIEKWKNVSSEDDADDSVLGVWDGSPLG